MNYVRERLGEERVSERRACRVLGQARSTQRRERAAPEDEPRLVGQMVELASEIWPLRIPQSHGDAAVGRMASESQAGGTAVEARRVESALQAAQTAAVVAE